MADNIYMKLAQMRVELQQMNIKKSGHNDYSNYDYYELADILPPINSLQLKYKTCSFVTFTNETAELTLVNAEEPSEVIRFTSPMAELTLKAANAMQNLGGVETYQRRYLYMAAFEIVENDFFDAIQGKEQRKNPPPKQKGNPKKPEKPDKKPLSEAASNELNLKIKEYKALSGIPVPEITKKITQAIGKDLRDVTDEDAKEIFTMLKSWIDDYTR